MHVVLMRTSSIAAWLVPLLLLLSGCASGRSAAPSRAAGASSQHAQQISPAHPYCMFVPSAGELRECYQFAFGRCTAYGARCSTPGPIRSGASEQGTGGSTDQSP